MGRILSQDEIDALLGSSPSSEATSRVPGGHDPVVTYDFRRPDRASREQIRSLHVLHDRFARNMSTSLSAYLRAVTEVTIVSVEQFTYSEFLMSLPDPTAYYSLTLQPMEGIGALELNPSVAFTMIDRMLGGKGQRVSTTRALTEIEQNVVDGVVKLVLENLSETWATIVPVRFKTKARETRPQMLQVAAPNDPMILLAFDIRIGGSRGMLNFCIPTSVIEAFGASFTQGWYRTKREPTEEERIGLLENLARVPLPVAAVLCTTLSGRELLELRPGDVVSLGLPVQRPLTVRIGQMDQFEGVPVRTGGSTGVALTAAIGSAGEGVAR
jgi:flagellar motor switch protein FliM